MPNRVLKESILTSETVGSLDHFTWRLFVSLICLADDYGRGKANPSLLKGAVFPMCEAVTAKQVEKSLYKLHEVGAIFLYKSGDSHYYCFPTWAKHQRLRNSIERFPAPPADELQKFADKCQRVAESCDNSPQIAASCGNLPLESNPIQSNPIQSKEKSAGAPAYTREEKHKYGEYLNVLLTDDELEKLKAEYPDYKERIERLSSYIASSGKSYKSHYATIRVWARSEKTSKQDSKVVKPSMTDYYNEDVAKWLENAYGKDNEFNKILGETK